MSGSQPNPRRSPFCRDALYPFGNRMVCLALRLARLAGPAERHRAEMERMQAAFRVNPDRTSQIQLLRYYSAEWRLGVGVWWLVVVVPVVILALTTHPSGPWRLAFTWIFVICIAAIGALGTLATSRIAIDYLRLRPWRRRR
jgi:hypothetical protein